MTGDQSQRKPLEFAPGYIEPVSDELTLHEKFRLLEIAHETNNFEIRSAALRLFDYNLNPVFTFKASDHIFDQNDHQS
jgi:hypothetical protein